MAVRDYSPWTGSDLHLRMRAKSIDTIVVTGGETDVCVLATALGAIDWGFRVIPSPTPCPVRGRDTRRHDGGLPDGSASRSSA